MLFKFKAKLFQIADIRTGESASGPWKSQDIVVSLFDEMDTKVCLNAMNDRVDMVSSLKKGDAVEVTFSVSAREYNERWYNSLRIYQIFKADECKVDVVECEAPNAYTERHNPAPAPAPAPAVQATQVPQATPVVNNDNDDLPF
jgi:hypothetical protein